MVNNKLWKNDVVKVNHFNVIKEFLEYLNTKSSEFILKGGTSLMMCYSLDRFSEDIDLDSTNKKIFEYVDKFCCSHGYTYRIAKDTDTTKRVMLHYSENNRPLKIEISYRQKYINPNRIQSINGIMVYNIDELFGMKMNAYNGRDKIRDLYDVVFIYKNYKDFLSEERIEMFKDVLSYKGLEQFDYLINTQEDDLIDKKVLGEDFLEVFDDLNLFDDYEIEEIEHDDLERE